ncbi:MAG TPA: hypothetical protein VNU93_03905, partial [Verrucomicrobiae bacterium]|nr:hypothetical protein [Verrucomicrobiae bacterium]
MKERVISLSILVFSLVYLAGSISLSVGTIDRPGPGFLPAGIAVALLVVAGFNVFKAFRTGSEPAGDSSWLQATPIGIALIL